MFKRTTWAVLSVALMGTSLLNTSLATPKKVMGYGSLGIVDGKQGGSYTLVLGDSPQSLFYYGVVDSNLGLVSQQMFDTLLEFNLATYKLEPALAESWTVSPDGKVYVFKLRKDVKWSDGQGFDADDVVFTYKNIIMNPEARAGDPANFKLDGQNVEISKVDQYTVKLTLPRAAPAFLLQQRAYFMMPKHKLLKYSIEGGAKPADINTAWPTNVNETEVIGTGPFKLSSYTVGQKVSLIRNPYYWKVDAKGQKLPYLNSLDFLIIRDPQAQVAQFLAGNVDQLNITGAQFPDLKQKEVAGAPFKVFRSTALFGSPPFVAYNFDAKDPALAKVFSDVRFRKAMQSALNRDRIIDTVYNGLASLPGHGVAPVNKAWYANTTKQLGSFDLGDAGKALDALGVKKNAAGMRVLPSGKALEFDLTYGTDSSVYPQIATIIQSDFGKLGVKVNLKGILSSKLLSTGQSGDWEMILHAFGDQPDPELRRPIWQPGGALYYWHRSTRPDVDGTTPVLSKMAPWEKDIYNIFQQAAVTSSVSQRKALYTRWQLIFAQNLPVTPIAKPENIGAVSNKYGNYIYNLGVIPGYNPVPLIYQK